MQGKLARYLDESFTWVPGNTIKKPVVDPNRPVVYGFDDQKNVISYDYKTKEKKVIKLDFKTEKMIVSDNMLYVLLMTRENHDPYWFHNQQGAVAVIDTKTFSLVKVISIAVDPYDIAIDDSYIYIAPGSGQDSKLYRYSKLTHEFLGSVSIFGASAPSTIRYSKQQNKFYSIQHTVSPRKMSAHQFLEDYSGTIYSQSPYHGHYALTPLFYLSPDGKYLFNGSGNVFHTSNDKETDMTFVKKIAGSSPNAFLSMDFNLTDGKFYTGGYVIRVFDYDTLELMNIFSNNGMEHYYVFYNNQLLTTVGEKALDLHSRVRKSAIGHYRTDNDGVPLIPEIPKAYYHILE